MILQAIKMCIHTVYEGAYQRKWGGKWGGQCRRSRWKKYKNSRRKAKGTMNRQRNSWISEKGYTSCCTDPGFVSQIGVHIVSERGWTVDLWRQSCTEHFITLSPSWKIHAFPSAPMCDKGLCLPLFHHLFFLWDYWIQDTCRIWIISYFFPFSGCLSGLIPILAFLCQICIFSPYLCGFFSRYSGPTGPDGPACPVLNWFSCPSGVDSSHMLTVRKV